MINVQTILALVFSVVVGYIYFRGRRTRELMAKLPGPKARPIVGNIFDFLVPKEELWDLLRQHNDNYYPIYRIWTVAWNVINMRHPDDVEVLLTSQKNISKSALYDFLHPWFQFGLLTSTGSKWQKRRKILTPAFHFNILREFVNVFDEESKRMVDEIKTKTNDRVFDLLPLITKYTLNTICETAMGTSLSESTTFHTKYRESIHQMGVLLLHRLLRPWLHPDFVFRHSPSGKIHDKALKIIHNFSKKIIRERQDYHDETGGINNAEIEESSIDTSKSKKRLAMLDLLITSMREGHIDEAGIREEVDTFMFEGHDTSAMGICFTLALLAEHKDIQERARKEIDTVLDGNGGKMDYTAIQQLTYLDRCIKESLRLFPSVHFISRYLSEDMYLKNYTIPKDTIAHIHIYDLHRDPNFWPDPHTFDPDRFLHERTVGRHPFAYIPFSAGPRNCIGQKFAMLELKSMIGHLLRNFYLEPIDLASEAKLLPDLVLRPSHPLRVKFITR